MIAEKFAEKLKKLPVGTDTKVLLALSGGLDSVVLFHLLLQARIPFATAHINYGLRGEASEGDEAFCRDLCLKNNIPFFLYDARNEMQAELGKGIQELAREIRYSFFKSLCDRECFEYTLTAHHANDSLETFFINLLRGSGIQGLKGIPEKNDKIIRPLLTFSRKELEKFAQENNINHREDASNEKDDYLRNRIRHHVIPSLEIADHTALKRVTESMKNISREADLLDYLLRTQFPVSIVNTPKSVIFSFPQNLQSTVIFKRFQSIGLQFNQAESIAECLSGISGKQFFTSSHRVVVDRDFILVDLLSEAHFDEISVDGNLQISGYEITIKNMQDVDLIKDSNCAFLDADKIKFPMTWRNIQTGDSMNPFGMRGRKKVSDILTDLKMDRITKDKLHVLVSDGEIIWLEGFRISDSSKITAQTSRVLCIIPEKL